MTTVEREALAQRADLKPIVKKNVHRAAWGDLAGAVQRKLADAVEPNANQDATYTKAVELVRGAGAVKRPAIQDALGIGFDEVNALMERMERDGVVTAAKPNGERSLVDRAADEVQAFAPETGTLGIPRADMPQVPTRSHGGLVKHLNAQGIAHETTTVNAAGLKPTQAEYSPAKVEAAKTLGGDRAVLVSNDGHIIDGHHQAMAAAEDGKPVKAIVLDAPVDQALEAVKNSPSAQADTEAVPPAAAPTAKKRVQRGILAKKAEAEEKARADYFTPGNIVKSYGGHDRVVCRSARCAGSRVRPSLGWQKLRFSPLRHASC